MAKFRQFELAAVLVFILLSAALVVVNTLFDGSTPLVLSEDSNVTAQANAMPAQGWAPLHVFFSAYGSQSINSRIRQIQWDLDGNGLVDYDSTEEGGYASYLYSKPGIYTVTLWVIDELGRAAKDQVQIEVRHPASSSVDYWSIFDDSRVGRIEVSLTQADWQRMWDDPEAKVEVPADAVILGERLERVGFRMRGQFSLRVSGEKKPWKINTDAYIDGQEFRNLKMLVLLNNIGDPSMLREKVAYDMMRFAGAPVGFASFVELWIDIEDDDQPTIFWGIYTLVERVDAKFLANRFGQDSKDGNLYKASHAQRGPMDLVYYGPKIEDYPTQGGNYAYGKMNNEAEADYTDIVRLCWAVDGAQYATDESYIDALESEINVDSFLRYMAVVMVLDNWDSYPFTGNNFYLFNNPVSDRFEWIPWDLSIGGNPHAPLFWLGGERLVQRAPMYDKVLQIPYYRSKYIAYIDLLARYWFTDANLTPLIQGYHKQISPYVLQGDKMFSGGGASFAKETYLEAWQELINFIRSRSQFILEQLSSEMQ